MSGLPDSAWDSKASLTGKGGPDSAEGVLTLLLSWNAGVSAVADETTAPDEQQPRPSWRVLLICAGTPVSRRV
jgi:hypothetical protein